MVVCQTALSPKQDLRDYIRDVTVGHETVAGQTEAIETETCVLTQTG